LVSSAQFRVLLFNYNKYSKVVNSKVSFICIGLVVIFGRDFKIHTYNKSVNCQEWRIFEKALNSYVKTQLPGNNFSFIGFDSCFACLSAMEYFKPIPRDNLYRKSMLITMLLTET
jgi:hypothetical protein